MNSTNSLLLVWLKKDEIAACFDWMIRLIVKSSCFSLFIIINNMYFLLLFSLLDEHLDLSG